MQSMLYTMGTALSRAAENGHAVALLVEGQWLQGHVAASDGVGVVLECANGQHSVVRTERISAVTVMAESPLDTVKITMGGSGGGFGGRFGPDGPVPMPGAQAPGR